MRREVRLFIVLSAIGSALLVLYFKPFASSRRKHLAAVPLPLKDVQVESGVSKSISSFKSSSHQVDGLDSLLRSLSFKKRMFQHDAACPRILVIESERGGLGHLFMALVFGILTADSANATLVVPPAFFGGHSNHKPQGYGWFEEFAGLKGLFPTQVPSGAAQLESVSSWKGMSEAFTARPCNRTLTVASGHRTWCPVQGWCIQEMPLGFRTARPFFEALQVYKRLNAGKKHRSKLQVAWHVRVGDQELGSAEANLKLSAFLKEHLPSDLAEVTVFASQPLCRNDQGRFCEWTRKHPSYTFSTERDEREVLRCMILADLLITGGSSFGSIAAQLSSPSQVVLSFPAKEGPIASQAYNRGDALDIDYHGNPVDIAKTVSVIRKKLLRRVFWEDVSLVGPIAIGSTEKDFSGFEGTVSVERVVSEIPARATAIHPQKQQCGDYWKEKLFKSEVAVIRVRGGRVLCDGDTRFGCVLVGRSQHYALRETLDMQQFTPNEMAKLDIPKTGEYLPHNEQPVRDGTLLIAVGMWGATFQHFLQDLVDIIGLLWDEVAADPKVRLLVNCYGYNGPNVKQLIQLLGLSERVLCMQGGGKYFESRGLLFVRKANRIPGTATIGLLRIRDELMKRIAHKRQRRNLVVVFSRHAGTRKLANMKDLTDRLQGWLSDLFGSRLELMIEDPSKWTMKESLEHMSRTALVVHMHGGNLFHSVGMPEGSIVLEMVPERGMCTLGYTYNMALKHIYFHVPVDGDREGAFSTLRKDDFEALLVSLGPELKRLVAVDDAMN